MALMLFKTLFLFWWHFFDIIILLCTTQLYHYHLFTTHESGVDNKTTYIFEPDTIVTRKVPSWHFIININKATL